MEPISIFADTLGAAFLKEGIKFLWEQAGKIIDRYHKKKEKNEEKKEINYKELATIDDPVPEFISLSPVRSINFSLADKKIAELKSLRKELSIYALGDEEIRPENKNMLAHADQLQQLLGEIFGEDVNVPQFRVQQFIENIKKKAKVTGVETEIESPANIDVEQRVKNVEGELAGVKINRPAKKRKK
jgi:hypothetical protein